MELGQIYIPAQSGNTGLDVWGNPLKNNKGLVHNGCEVFLQQHPDATQLLDKIIVTIDMVEYEFHYDGVDGNNSPTYKNTINTMGSVYQTGGHWVYIGPVGPSTNPAVAGVYPTKHNWPNASGGETISIDYNSNWIMDNGNLINRDYNNFLAIPNLVNDELLTWKRMTGGGCGVSKDAQLTQWAVINFDEAEYLDSVNLAGDLSCGRGILEILRDSNGDVIYDVDGELIYLQPERPPIINPMIDSDGGILYDINGEMLYTLP